VKADRPLAMVDMYGTPFTDALHVVERYRLLDYEATIESEQRGQRNLRRLQGSDPGFTRNPNYKGKGLLLQFTVEDPGVFTTPWSAGITYRRPLGTWPEWSAPKPRVVTSPESTTPCRLRASPIFEADE
jgi:hypothetical protein